MNSPIDERELDDYLRGSSDVSRRYRSIANEEPSAELDRAVLAQGRAAAESKSKVVRFSRRSAVRWFVPSAVAATVVLTFSIVHETGIAPNVAPRESTAPV